MQKSQQNTLSANQDRGEIILCRDTPEVRAEFNRSVLHPLQLCQWGDFKECTGHEIRRYKLHLPDSRTYYAQLIVVPEPAPFLYWPRGPLPDHQILALLQRIGKEEGVTSGEKVYQNHRNKVYHYLKTTHLSNLAILLSHKSPIFI